MKTLRFVVQLALGIALPLFVQRWDLRRLSPERRMRAWNVATWATALYAFGPFSMLGWAWVTRRDLWLSLASRVVAPSTRARRAVAIVIAFVTSLVVSLCVAVAPLALAIALADHFVARAAGLEVEPLF